MVSGYRKLITISIYSDVYDARSYESELGDQVQIRDLLRFCLQRPANCSLIGRTTETSLDISALLSGLGLNSTKDVASTTSVITASTSVSATRSSRKPPNKRRPVGIAAITKQASIAAAMANATRIDPPRCPALLPWGRCEIARNDAVFGGYFSCSIG